MRVLKRWEVQWRLLINSLFSRPRSFLAGNCVHCEFVPRVQRPIGFPMVARGPCQGVGRGLLPRRLTPPIRHAHDVWPAPAAESTREVAAVTEHRSYRTRAVDSPPTCPGLIP